MGFLFCMPVNMVTVHPDTNLNCVHGVCEEGFLDTLGPEDTDVFYRTLNEIVLSIAEC